MMLYWALVFLLLAAAVAPFGFGVLTTAAAGAANGAFLVLFALLASSVLVGTVWSRPPAA
jgi:uncharacterized membrane protein YtjA (UPF0391 family)